MKTLQQALPGGRAARPMLTLAVVLALSAMFWIGAFIQWRSLGGLNTSLETRQALVKQLEARAARPEPLVENHGNIDGKSSTVLLLGETQGLMAAEMQRVLAFIVENRGGRLRSAEIDDPVAMSDAQPLRKPETAEPAGAGSADLFVVRARLRIEIDEQAMPDLLQDLERENPLLRIDALSLRAPRQIGDVSAPGLSAGAARILDITIDIAGFWAPAEEAA